MRRRINIVRLLFILPLALSAASVLSLASCRGGGPADPDGRAADAPGPVQDATVRGDRHAAGPYRAYLGTMHDHHYAVNAGDDGGLAVNAPNEPGITGSPEWWDYRRTHPDDYAGGDAASAFARGAAEGLDFMGLTPHNHLIDNDEYGAVLDAAASAVGIVPLVGQEWSSIDSGNHTIVMGVVLRVTVPNGEYGSLIDSWLPGYISGHPLASTTWVQRPMLILAHPAIETWSYGPAEKAVYEYGLDDWPTRAAWAAALNEYARLVELMTASEGDENGLPRTLELWNDGVRVGLSVGPDNHRQQWGDRTDARVGVLSSAWAAEEISEGLHARRTYATEDRDLGAHLAVLDSTGAVLGWMGEEIDSPGPTLMLELGLEDPTSPGATYTVEVLADDATGGAQASAVPVTGGSGSFPEGTRQLSVSTPSSGGYIVVHVTSGAVDTWFSPIWIR